MIVNSLLDKNEWTIQITFLEPYRTADRTRHSRDAAYIDWHKTSDCSYRPYFRGNLFRSKVLHNIEEIIAREQCKTAERLFDPPLAICSGEFRQRPDFKPPKHLRRKGIYEIKTIDGKKTCKIDANACPLCLFLGRPENKRQEDDDPKNRPVHFTNFSITEGEYFNNIDGLAPGRPINRVEQQTGKARDYMTIREADNHKCPTYTGKITFTTQDEYGNLYNSMVTLKKLIALAIAQMNLLSGALCRVDILDSDGQGISEHQALIRSVTGLTESDADVMEDVQGTPTLDVAGPINIEGTGSSERPKENKLLEDDNKNKTVDPIDMAEYKALADDIAAVLVRLGKTDCIRRTAEVMKKWMQSCNESPLDNIPKENRGGSLTPWFKPTDGRISIEMIKMAWSEAQERKISWQNFCRNLGHALYERSKAEDPLRLHNDRLLGDNVFTAAPATALDWIPIPSDITTLPLYRKIFTGQLRAEAPFFCGTEPEDDQTSLAVLLTSDGYLRIPRTALRGILRRDLKALLGGIGCNAELEKPTICECQICRILNRIQIGDTKSTYKIAPDVRNRIRIDPHTMTVNMGALFDIELGLTGLIFPFRLYYAAPVGETSPVLNQVLSLWNQGMLFLGGQQGTGKGRFSLTDLKAYNIDLSKRNAFAASLLARGYQDMDQVHLDAECIKDDAFTLPAVEHPVWERVHYDLIISSPILSNDPITAYGYPNNETGRLHDTAMTTRMTIKYDEITGDYIRCRQYILKGEGIRGALRYQTGKHGADLHERFHDECSCNLCRVTGNEHHRGFLMVEDIVLCDVKEKTIVENAVLSDVEEKTFDHVSIDRPRSKSLDQAKFDDTPLVGKDGTIQCKGTFWVDRRLHAETYKASKDLFIAALADLRDGLLPLGGKTSIGYGQATISNLSEPWQSAISDIPPLTSIYRCEKDDRMPLDTTKFVKPPLEQNHIYHPYYLIPPSIMTAEGRQVVERTRNIVSHTRYYNNRHTGKLVCTIETKGPIFLPDAESAESAGKQYQPFLKVGNQLAISGSMLKGPLSTVFECLTNSCYRVFDVKYRPSWRITPKSGILQDYHPGRVYISEKGTWQVAKMKEVRLPFYDDQDITSKVSDLSEADKSIAKSSNVICNALETIKISDKEKFEHIIAGLETIKVCTEKAKKSNKHDIIVVGFDEKKSEVAYLKISGPNVIEIYNDHGNAEGIFPDISTLSDELIYLFHNDIDGDSPVLKTQETTDGKTMQYLMKKRCERAFISIDAAKTSYHIPNSVITRYRELIEKQNKQPQKPPLKFQTRPLRDAESYNGLRDGDLVYFRCDDKKPMTAKDIVPVRISRYMSPKTMGNILDKEFLPCTVNGINGNDFEIEVSSDMAPFQLPHPDGLCPACHLFGTSFYKGRVRFGFAKLKGEPHWYIPEENGTNNSMWILPQESPRYSWSIPISKDYNEDGLEILGRSFYVHHPKSADFLRYKQAEIEKIREAKAVQPLANGNQFTFDVHFDNLSTAELGLLIYTIELQDGLAHKIGRAKEQGFGSVVMTVKNIQCRQDIDIPIEFEIGKITKKQALINAGIKSLEEQFGKNFYQIDHVKKLLTMLWLPSEDEQWKVYYAKLNAQDDGVPGRNYAGGYNYDTIRKWNQETRKRLLTKPWVEWHPHQADPSSTKQPFEPLPSQQRKRPTKVGTNINVIKGLESIKLATKKQRPEWVSNKLFVDGLDEFINNVELRNHFSTAGSVILAKVIHDKKHKGRSFGFVDMRSINEAEKAILTLNNSLLAGRKILVDWYKPKPK